MHYVYILKFQEQKSKNFYIGYTADLRKRLKEHIDGLVRTTKNKKLKLIYYEAYNDKYLALKREKGIKTSGSVYMALMKRIKCDKKGP
jgi:putative endonuclease